MLTTEQIEHAKRIAKNNWNATSDNADWDTECPEYHKDKLFADAICQMIQCVQHSNSTDNPLRNFAGMVEKLVIIPPMTTEQARQLMWLQDQATLALKGEPK
jgi:hypothetical protein